MNGTQIVVLGGGTGGTMAANRLRRRFDPDEAEIHVVDRDDRHVYQPGLLFVPFGWQMRMRSCGRAGVNSAMASLPRGEVDSVCLDRDEVLLADGSALPYDVLVVATGARLQPEETEGMTGPGWNDRVFTFYEPDSAARCAARSSASTAVGCSSTSSTCRSSARWLRSSSPSSRTGSCTNETSATGRRSRT